ncbi:helix-turn-helix domain-containing protein [Undibacterium terreum]|uniref:HTH araC/xylS-type domain-containing protein n=1 Tax=Undibacterium terreum TaxID=1224302 RepID=A0A916XDS3_9BURK|nr:AraC family transcriptional regulator [Undibacterium terreum]GGC64461.1 hypothetical protein GCM10011396_09290 [Undibacterium terreum]
MTALEYKISRPIKELSPFVESFWMIVNESEDSHKVTVMPDGRVDIHFFYSDREAFHASIAGLEHAPSQTEIPARSVMFAVSFKLLAMEYVLGASVAALVNDRALLPDDFWGICKDDLDDFDQFCRKLSDRIHQLIRAGNKPVDPRKLKMNDAIYASKGAASVQAISEAAHWSSRQINRYFNQWFGLSLKAYCSILRFRASFAQISEGKLFPEDFFADQAHFIKEVKKYSGYTPKELYKNKDGRFIQLSTLK